MLIENIKKVKPTFNKIILTADRYEEDVIVNGLIDVTRSQGMMKDIQKVVSVGEDVKCCKPGDTVIFNIASLEVWKYSDGSVVNPDSIRSDINQADMKFCGYKIPTITLDGKEYINLFDRFVTFVVEEFDMVENGKPKTDIVIPKKPEIIIPR